MGAPTFCQSVSFADAGNRIEAELANRHLHFGAGFVGVKVSGVGVAQDHIAITFVSPTESALAAQVTALAAQVTALAAQVTALQSTVTTLQSTVNAATANNTSGTIVKRDGDKNFAANFVRCLGIQSSDVATAVGLYDHFDAPIIQAYEDGGQRLGFFGLPPALKQVFSGDWNSGSPGLTQLTTVVGTLCDALRENGLLDDQRTNV